METLKILVFNWRYWLNPAMGGAEVFTSGRNIGDCKPVVLFCA
jgi:hypothetical protein